MVQEYRIEKYPPYLQLKMALDSLLGIPVRGEGNIFQLLHCELSEQVMETEKDRVHTQELWRKEEMVTKMGRNG